MLGSSNLNCLMRYPFFFFLFAAVLSSCSPSIYLSKSVRALKKEDGFRQAHLGGAVYDVASGKPLYGYQSEKYFVPASNVKIFTLYAALTYLKDSIPGIFYRD